MFRQFLDAISQIMVNQLTLLQLPKKRHLSKIVLIFRDVGHVLFFKSGDHGCAVLQLEDAFPIYILYSKLESHQRVKKNNKKHENR